MKFVKRYLQLLVPGISLVALATLALDGNPFRASGPTAQAASAPGVAVNGDANIYVNLAKRIVPSVVNISTYTNAKQQMMPGTPDDFFHRFFEDMLRRRRGGPDRGGPEDDEQDNEGGGDEPPRRKGGAPRAMSLGTGFIIDASGLILTNNHVVGDADEIKISFTEDPNEKPTDGTVVGRDPELDVALVKVKTKRELIPMVLGDSEALEVGEYVMAVGNPFGQGHSVTHGIISAKGRIAPDFPLARYIQTDAPINPGNSGGPLVNLKGEVIGINNAIEQRAQNIGFAIPISIVKQILPQLKSKGTVARGYIGVLINPVTPEIAAKLGLPKGTDSPIVSQVLPGEAADKAGIKPYDVVLEFNGKRIRSHNDLIMAVTAVSVGDSVPIKIWRAGEEKTLAIKVTQRPTSPGAPEKEKPKKKEKRPKAPETGMSLEDLTPEIARELGMPAGGSGVIVSSTSYGGPADRAGLLRGDVILEVDRKPVKDVDAFYAIVKDKKSYLLRVRRSDPQGNEAFLVVILDLKE